MKRLFILLGMVYATILTQAQYSAPEGEVPAYHATPPSKNEALPAVMTEQQLANAGLNAPAQRAAYKAATRIPAVLHQLPCYCYCDRAHGHKSLHSCFESAHGANCGVCMGEALYAYKMSKKGWTAKMIREGIMRGEYKSMDLQNPDPVL